MSRQPSNIDKILDISSFTASRGFIVSSSDEDDNVNELKKSSTTVRSKLSNIFATTSQKAPKEDQNASRRQPIFANSVGLFTAGESGELQSRGQVGIAVTDNNGKYILLIYNAAKQVMASFPLTPGSVEFSVRYGKDSYLYLSTPPASLTLHFDESKLHSGLHILASLLLILCGLEECLLYSGEGEACFPGCHVLFEERRISLDEGELHVEQRPQEKKKLSQTGPLLGLGKGGIRIVKTSESSASIVTAVKIKYPSDHAKVESETSSLVPTDSPQVADLFEAEVEAELVKEKTDDIMSRIAKVGQAIIPFIPPPEPSSMEKEEEKELATVSHQEEEPSVVEAPVPMPREYPVFHRVIGTEMDRLEIRLEASVQRMIDRALEPLRGDLQRLLTNQEKILAELQDLRKMKD